LRTRVQRNSSERGARALSDGQQVRKSLESKVGAPRNCGSEDICDVGSDQLKRMRSVNLHSASGAVQVRKVKAQYNNYEVRD
jgi:hypothetical protein